MTNDSKKKNCLIKIAVIYYYNKHYTHLAQLNTQFSLCFTLLLLAIIVLNNAIRLVPQPLVVTGEWCLLDFFFYNHYSSPFSMWENTANSPHHTVTICKSN